eukprot:scaffold13631_cov38-Cyclotella_meneghiniana.AAC.2
MAMFEVSVGSSVAAQHPFSRGPPRKAERRAIRKNKSTEPLISWAHPALSLGLKGAPRPPNVLLEKGFLPLRDSQTLVRDPRHQSWGALTD